MRVTVEAGRLQRCASSRVPSQRSPGKKAASTASARANGSTTAGEPAAARLRRDGAVSGDAGSRASDGMGALYIARSVGGWASCTLEDRGNALPAADAHGLQPVPGVAPLHFVQQRGHDAHAGGAHRMAQRNTRAVDVQAVL